MLMQHKTSIDVLNYNYRPKILSKLLSLIDEKKSVALISPKLFGKKFISRLAIQESKLFYSYMDFFSVMNIKDIKQVLDIGAQKLVENINKVNEHQGTQNSKLNLKDCSDEMLSGNPVINSIIGTLEWFAQVSKILGKNIILFFDNIDRALLFCQKKELDIFFYRVAQLARKVSCIFSGNAYVLKKLFFKHNDSPLNNAAEILDLGLIPDSQLSACIKAAANKKWENRINNEVTKYIIEKVWSHPYYLNLLCERLFSYTLAPGIKSIEKEWENCIEILRPSLICELSLFKKSDLKILSFIARHGALIKPLGNDVANETGVYKAGVTHSLAHLEKTGYVFKDMSEQYKMHSPAIAHILKRLDSNAFMF